MFIKTLSKKPDIIIGNRNRKNRFLEAIISILFKIKFDISDPLSGYKAYSKKIIEDLKHYKHNLFLTDIIQLESQKKEIS